MNENGYEKGKERERVSRCVCVCMYGRKSVSLQKGEKNRRDQREEGRRREIKRDKAAEKERERKRGSASPAEPRNERGPIEKGS